MHTQTQVLNEVYEEVDATCYRLLSTTFTTPLHHFLPHSHHRVCAKKKKNTKKFSFLRSVKMRILCDLMNCN